MPNIMQSQRVAQQVAGFGALYGMYQVLQRKEADCKQFDRDKLNQTQTEPFLSLVPTTYLFSSMRRSISAPVDIARSLSLDIGYPPSKILAGLRRDREVDREQIVGIERRFQNDGALRAEMLQALLDKFSGGVAMERALIEIKTALRESVFSEFTLSDHQMSTVQSLIDRYVDELPRYELHSGGGRFLKLDSEDFSDTHTSIFRHTRIRTIEGECFELVNRVYPDEARSLREQGWRSEMTGKCVLGEGQFGKVRVARRLTDGRFLAVKKVIDDPELFDSNGLLDEVNLHRKIKKGDHLIKLYGTAHLEDSRHRKKTYLIMDLAGEMDGNDAVCSLEDRIEPENQDSRIRSIAKQYLMAVAELHDQGIFHLDIKLENFIHHFKDGGEEIKLGDFGISTCSRYLDTIRGTDGFLAPEVYQPEKRVWAGTLSRPLARGITPVGGVSDQTPSQPHPEIKVRLYDAIRRDSWALGMTLLLLKFRTDFEEMDDCYLSVYQFREGRKPIERYKVCFNDQNECVGFENTDGVVGITLDEVIIKLLERNPKRRITPAEALRLPYFR